MTAPATNYGELRSETQPEVVRSEQQNQFYIQKLEELTRREKVTAAEEKAHSPPHSPGGRVRGQELRGAGGGSARYHSALDEVHNLRQKDLVDVFGTESIVSDVLNGKRDLAKEHIRRLSARFHVSPAVFF